MADPLEPVLAPFLAGQWPYVESLPAIKAAEGLHTDYSRKEDPTTGALSTKDRQQLATALSGFANSEGGVFVWGVEAKPGTDGLDCVQQIYPIRELTRFIAEIEGAVPELVSFPVSGLRHIPIRRPPDSDDTGVVLTVVPQSDRTPHMARAQGQRRYYFRSGSQFLPMEHFMVADMFGRRARPVVKVELEWRARVTSYSASGNNVALEVQAWIANDGRGLLRHPTLCLSEPARWGFEIRDYGMMTRPSRRWWRQWIAGTDLVIHPNDRVRLVSLQRALPEGLSEWPDLHLEYFAAAEHSEPDEGELNVPGRLIREQALVEFARRMT